MNPSTFEPNISADTSTSAAPTTTALTENKQIDDSSSSSSSSSNSNLFLSPKYVAPKSPTTIEDTTASENKSTITNEQNVKNIDVLNTKKVDKEDNAATVSSNKHTTVYETSEPMVVFDDPPQSPETIPSKVSTITSIEITGEHTKEVDDTNMEINIEPVTVVIDTSEAMNSTVNDEGSQHHQEKSVYFSPYISLSNEDQDETAPAISATSEMPTEAIINDTLNAALDTITMAPENNSAVNISNSSPYKYKQAVGLDMNLLIKDNSVMLNHLNRRHEFAKDQTSCADTSSVNVSLNHESDKERSSAEMEKEHLDQIVSLGSELIENGESMGGNVSASYDTALENQDDELEHYLNRNDSNDQSENNEISLSSEKVVRLNEKSVRNDRRGEKNEDIVVVMDSSKNKNNNSSNNSNVNTRRNESSNVNKTISNQQKEQREYENNQQEFVKRNSQKTLNQQQQQQQQNLNMNAITTVQNQASSTSKRNKRKPDQNTVDFADPVEQTHHTPLLLPSPPSNKRPALSTQDNTCAKPPKKRFVYMQKTVVTQTIHRHVFVELYDDSGLQDRLLSRQCVHESSKCNDIKKSTAEGELKSSDRKKLESWLNKKNSTNNNQQPELSLACFAASSSTSLDDDEEDEESSDKSILSNIFAAMQSEMNSSGEIGRASCRERV